MTEKSAIIIAAKVIIFSVTAKIFAEYFNII